MVLGIFDKACEGDERCFELGDMGSFMLSTCIPHDTSLLRPSPAQASAFVWPAEMVLSGAPCTYLLRVGLALHWQTSQFYKAKPRMNVSICPRLLVSSLCFLDLDHPERSVTLLPRIS